MADGKVSDVVVVVGSTGVGKSKLAVDLARHLGGEVVNADALQVYRGLDVTTNKVTDEEAKGVPHHLIGFLDADAEYTAQQFRDDAIPIIEEIHQRGKLPLIVGGSNYYVQALVSRYLLDERQESEEGVQVAEVGQSAEIHTQGRGHVGATDSSKSPHDVLADVDPVAAARLHPNDRRKASRYLEIFRSTGQKPSAIFKAQKEEQELRYRCCWLWLDAEQGILDEHLSARVRDMMSRGLLEEVRGILRKDGGGAFTAGLRQAIGVREFEAYFQGPSQDVRTLESGGCSSLTLLDEALEAYVLNTSRLARRQRRRLAGLAARGHWELKRLDVTPIFEAMYSGDGREKQGGLGCSPSELWESRVVKPALEIVGAFLLGDVVGPRCGAPKHSEQRPDPWVQRTCEACGGRVLRGDHEWEAHVKGRNHRKRVASQRKRVKHNNQPEDQGSTPRGSDAWGLPVNPRRPTVLQEPTATSCTEPQLPGKDSGSSLAPAL